MKKPLLSPRFVGARFAEHTIPLELLKDLAVLEEFIIAVAKWLYVNEHERQRAPKGFTDHLSIHLASIGKGSAVPAIVMEYDSPSPDLFPAANEDYFLKAVDAIASAVDAAEKGNSASAFLSRELLGYFDRLGRGLQDSETLELKPASERPARLTKISRRKLLLESKNEEITEEVVLRGMIHEVNQMKMSFELVSAGGKRTEVRMNPVHLDVVLEATNGYRDGQKVSISGIGRFDRSERLQSIDQIEDIAIIDATDPLARIDELRLLKTGWLDGRGRAPSADDFDWLEKFFRTSFPSNLPTPLIFPTPEGGVQLEWALDSIEITLDVDLASKAAELHAYDFSNDEDIFEEVKIDQGEGMEMLFRTISAATQGGLE